MTLRPVLSVIARVELGLVVLLVFLFAVGFGIDESDDVWALTLSSVVLAAAPVLALLLLRWAEPVRAILAAILLASWVPTIWWLVTYA